MSLSSLKGSKWRETIMSSRSKRIQKIRPEEYLTKRDNKYTNLKDRLKKCSL